jgi:hypothetical protein
MLGQAFVAHGVRVAPYVPGGLTTRRGSDAEMVAASLVQGHGWTGIGPTAFISDWQAVLADVNDGLLSSNLLRSKTP